MEKTMRLCSTEKEILYRLQKWHPHLDGFKLTCNDGADFVLEFDDISDDDIESLDITFEDIMFGDGYKSLAQCLTEMLVGYGLTVATAESLTGGNIAAKIVEIPGCSNVFYGGIVAYSNEAKNKYLGVAEETLSDFGAVSEQTAIEMATGLLSDEVDIGISTTGIAGPSGGSEQKPVGLVYIAITDMENTNVYKMFFNGNREQIRNQTRDMAIFYAIKHLELYY